MKVLMVNKFLHPAGGAETYTFKVGEYLKRQGCQVEYFGMDHKENVVGNRWGLYGDPVDFHKKGIFANLVNPFKIVSSPDAREKVKRILEEFQPDIMHLNNFNYQLTPSILEGAEEYRKNKKEKLRIVYTAHDPQLVCPNHYLYQPGTGQVCESCLGGSYMPCIRSRCIHGSFARSCLGALEAWYWKRRKIYGGLDVIICPSEFIKGRLDTDPLLAPKTRVLPNFVRPVTGKKKGKGSYILYFGRYSREKGILTLLEACRELPDIPFVFAGGGPLEDRIQETENIKNAGFLKDRELDQMISGARFTVCPSECNENCPFSVMESIMNGTPVLGAIRGGVPELIRPGKTGWLFPSGDRENLKNMIRKIWDSCEPEIFSESCAEVQFDTIEEYGKKLMEVYKGH